MKMQTLGCQKKYKDSLIEIDKLGEHFEGKQTNSLFKINSAKTTNNTPSKSSTSTTSYCIRTGERIPFNVEKPLWYKAYQVWAKTNNKNERENFCHFSGEPSNGETSVSNPILEKNMKFLKELMS